MRLRHKRPILRAHNAALGLTTSTGMFGLPGGIAVPTIAWLESNCSIQQFDYGNGNVQYEYTCVHFGSGNRRYRCRWRRWNNGAIQFMDCNELTRAHYHEVHGGSEGPQSYGTPQLPPYVPFVDESMSLNFGRVQTRNPEGPTQTPVCPVGQEVCGDALPGHPPPCCAIKVQGPTPAQRIRRRFRHLVSRFLGR